MKAILHQVRITPKKAEIIAGLVKNMPVKKALHLLQFTPKKAAKAVYKVVHSAASNAVHNFQQNMDDLVISEIYVTEGQTFKRHMPVSRGRSHPILKRTAHIVVKLNVATKETPTKKAPAPKKTSKKSVKTSK